MRRFTRDEIKRLESGSLYLATVEEGMADPPGGSTLLLESAEEEVIAAFGGKPKVKDVQGSGREQLLDAFSGNEKLEATEDSPAVVGYEISGDKIELTEESERDQRAYSRSIEESKKKTRKNLSEAERTGAIEELREAFGGTIPDLEEAIPEGELLQETVTIDQILEGNGRPFTFKGRALKIDRRNKNNRRYGRTITEKALKEAQTLMRQGRTFSVMSGHPKPHDTDPSNVVGKVKFFEINPEGWMPYEATLSNTTKGMDLQKLLKDRCIGDVSLRSKGRTATAKMNGEAIDEVIDLHFRGLDLVLTGSEEGAGVDEIFNAIGAN